jgi:hypothetical protein
MACSSTLTPTPAAGKGIPYTWFTQLLENTNVLKTMQAHQAGLFHGAAQSIAHDTLTVLSFDSEDFDPSTMHNPASNNSRITIPSGADGRYLVMARVFFAANATGYRQLRIRKSGSDIATLSSVAAINGAGTTVSISSVVALVAKEYLEIIAYQNSGGALDSGNGASRSAQNEFSVVRVA